MTLQGMEDFFSEVYAYDSTRYGGLLFRGVCI